MIDLHTHTCYSDGADDVRTLLAKAGEAGLSVLSITDHNNVGAYRDQALTDFPGELIPGVEILRAGGEPEPGQVAACVREYEKVAGVIGRH